MPIQQERTFEVPTDACGDVAEILARINDKWSIAILRRLRESTTRFNELQRVLGTITHKMLTQTLRGLERDGLVDRHVTPTVPPRVDYEITAMGLSALSALDVVARWALAHRSVIHAKRAEFDASPPRSPHLPPA